MKDDHEETGLISSWGVKHGLPSWKMTVSSWTDDLVVDYHPSFEKHDGVGRAVTVRLGLEARWITNEIMLGT